MLSWCHCLSAPRWPGRASGFIPHLHLPSRADGEHQRQQRRHGELWPRPSGPGIIKRAGPGGLRPEAAPLLRWGAETSADDQEGPQDAGSQWTEGTTSDTVLHTGASLDPPPHFILELAHLTFNTLVSCLDVKGVAQRYYRSTERLVMIVNQQICLHWLIHHYYLQ